MLKGAGGKNRHLGAEPSKSSLPYHPDFRGPVQVLTIDRPTPDNDETTTAQTVRWMADLVRQDSRHPIVRRAAYAAICGRSPRMDPPGQVKAIHTWIREHVRFVEDATLAGFAEDPSQAEVLVRPIDLLTMPEPKGDCDDFSMLAAAMLRAVGIPSAFRTVAAESGNPNYSHVYVVALLPSGEMPLDASHGPYAGWEAQRQGKTRDWPIEEPKEPMQQTLSGMDWNALAQSGVNITGQILTERLAVPQLNPGQSIQRPNEMLYQAPNGGYGVLAPVGGGSGMLLVVIGIAAIGLIFAMRREN